MSATMCAQVMVETEGKAEATTRKVHSLLTRAGLVTPDGLGVQVHACDMITNLRVCCFLGIIFKEV